MDRNERAPRERGAEELRTSPDWIADHTTRTSTVTWAVRYTEMYQLALVPIPPGLKGPLHPGWNKPGGYVIDAGEARRRWGELPDHGIGAVLAPSGLCSLDIDSPEHAEAVLGDLGIDLGALRKATPTIQGHPTRYRLMFKAPP